MKLKIRITQKDTIKGRAIDIENFIDYHEHEQKKVGYAGNFPVNIKAVSQSDAYRDAHNKAKKYLNKHLNQKRDGTTPSTTALFAYTGIAISEIESNLAQGWEVVVLSDNTHMIVQL